MNIKVNFKSGEIVEVTDELLASFLDGKTTPTESIAVLHAAKSDDKMGSVLRMAQKRGVIPDLLGEVTIKKVVVVNDRLLGLFLSGDTTPDETYAILKAEKSNPDVALFLDVAEAAGFLGKKRTSNGKIRHKNRKK